MVTADLIRGPKIMDRLRFVLPFTRTFRRYTLNLEKMRNNVCDSFDRLQITKVSRYGDPKISVQKEKGLNGQLGIATAGNRTQI
jgi:hypothetical protein